MKMRFAWYAGVSTALAASVVVSAFHQRANFYSAMVHLSQSSLSLMVLVNLVFVVYGSLIYGLQRLCFGPLRPVEIEQLYEKAWFAVTETCLAMTIFREEVGAFFLVMFTALVTGKVWGWIGEGRVEVLEQQPPANPRLFHTRLSISLLLSVIYDTWLLSYAVSTVVQQARPTMMVMFLFEFAVLTVCSFQTGFRYIVSLVEQRVVKAQTSQRLEDRRRQIREQRDAILRRRETEGAVDGEDEEELPDEDDVDEMDIEVPGWESKGQWVLTLDLIADFVKVGIYTAFFFVLFTFYGLPIHIIRDWFMTTRSFLKRLNALIRYRQALRDMNQYPDATSEELERENTCIICREEMRPWDAADGSQVERARAKKLPCGHILHFGCLKSWLERQQVCPTCRRPVAREGNQPARNGEAVMVRLGLNFPGGQNRQPQPPANGQAPGGQAAPAPANNQENNQGQNQNRGVRMFNLGPLRLGIAQGGIGDMQQMAQRFGMQADDVNVPAAAPPVADGQERNGDATPSLEQIRAQVLEVGQRVQREMLALHNAAHELQMLDFVINELTRLRQLQEQSQGQGQSAPQGTQGTPMPDGQLNLPVPPQQMPPIAPGMFPPIPHGHFQMQPLFAHRQPILTRHTAPGGYGSAIPSGSPDLPEGVVIPPGWTLLPLQRVEVGAAPAEPTDSHPAAAHDVVSDVSSTGATAASDLAAAPVSGQGVETTEATEATVVAPDWGGPAQLFGGSFAPPPQGESGEASDAATGVSGGPASESGTTSDEQNGSTDKGKTKAATVEEADDDEGH